MSLSEGIRRHGFCGWYERELGRSHLRLLLLIFAAVGVGGAVELFGRHTTASGQLGSLLLVVVSAGVAALALRRYMHLLGRAEFVANQAVCPRCRTYGRIRLDVEAAANDALAVRCAKCDAPWRIRDPDEGSDGLT